MTIAVVSLVLLLAGSVLLALRYDLYPVQTTVMDPAVGRGQQVLVASQTNGAQLRTGDVVVVASDGWADEPAGMDYILRVGAVAGDTILCCTDAGKVTVDGAVKEPPTITGDAPGAPAFNVKVPDGRVFLLGDRRDIARDSRAHLGLDGGTVPLSAVKGRVVAKLAPPGSVSGLDSGTGVSVNPLDPDGTYLYAAVLVLLGLIGLVYALVRALKARPRRPGESAVPVATG
ncbi:signal peptidase I [Micromonospora pattaloongensis]|uniref:signal peptidase I n=1 Tax=Micromonospora pattaloongensis TaxID=405436 RepID=UPI001587C037|nr:signal peptidase I [Micromonospora pattaloongensis]